MTISFCLLALPAKADNVQICGKLAQGQVLTGKAQQAEKIVLGDKSFDVADDGSFVFAFARDAVPEQKINIINRDGSEKTYNIFVEPTAWDIQDLKGIEQKKVTPSDDEQAEINRERQDIRAAQKENSQHLFWQQDFILPVEGRISGKFGGQRIMNGKKMNPHMGMDIAAIEGTPIKAPAGGVVTLSNNSNYFYSGNVVVLDHGQGLYTIYAHLKEATAKEGSLIKKGEVLGTVGKTGRVTGAHLHWGASANGTRFDPDSLKNKNNFCFNL